MHENVNAIEKTVELEKLNEKLTIEYNALKASIECKNSIESNQFSLLNNEFINWKNEMKLLNSKIIEQNSIIHKLVEKCTSMDKS